VNSWKVILATMVIFGAGVVTGGLVVRHAQRANADLPRPLRAAAQFRAALPPVAGLTRIEFLRRAERDLDLNRDQRERIDRLLKESQLRTRRLMEPIDPQIREELRRTKSEFLDVLTPEQRARFEDIVKQQQQHRRP